MLHSGCLRFHRALRALLGVALLHAFAGVRAEIIYNNSSTYLGSYVKERREYGDQVDLGGTARRLTEILFEYFASFAATGDETVKVRIYSNEKPYDDFRKAPTTLLYESDPIPIAGGYHTRLISGLNILLPMHTVTLTVQFQGVAETETAGLLFYGPPTEGYSFNEFWMRTATGAWAPVVYSTSDPNLRASAGLQLTASPEVLVDQQQNVRTSMVPLNEGTNRVRLAQTFTADMNGRLDHVTVALAFTNVPVRLRILDAFEGRPGPNALGFRNILSGTGAVQTVSFVDARINLEKGKQYAIELTAAGATNFPSHLAAASTDNYPGGALWQREETGGIWSLVNLGGPGQSILADAFFQTYIVPAEPAAEIMTPRPAEVFELGEPIVIRARHKTPEIGTITRMRFLDGSHELGVVTNAPYEFVWTNAATGGHELRAVAEDSFRRPFRSEFVSVTVREAGAPQNDLFARRLSLEGRSLRRMKPTGDATTEFAEPGLRTNNPARATLWWAWTAYDALPVTISAQNSSGPGASVAVFTGDTLKSLRAVTNGAPLVRFTPSPGVTYAISADPGNKGDQVALEIATAEVGIGHLSSSVARANDPLVVTLGGTSSRTITNVSLYLGDKLFGKTSTGSGTVTNSISTNGFFDLVAVAADDRGIETVSLPVRLAVRARNDAFADRAILNGEGVRTMFSPAAGTVERGESRLAELGYPQRSSSWWTWTAPGSGPVRLQVVSAGAAAAVAVFTGNSIGQLTLVGQNAGTGVIRFEAEGGRAYQVRVIGNSADSAPIELSLSMETPRINGFSLVDGSVTLNLEADAERTIFVEYSNDLKTWKRAAGPIPPGTTEPTWTDAGPPVTERHPREEKTRFYRVVAE